MIPKHYIKNILPKNRTTLNVLKRAIIRDGALLATDLDQWISIENDYTRANEGQVYDFALLKKTGDLETCKTSDTTDEEIPDGVKGELVEWIPWSVIPKLPGFVPYCSIDTTTRVVLTGICIDTRKGVVVGCNGNILRRDTFNQTHNINGDERVIRAETTDFIKAMSKESLLEASIVKEPGRDLSCIKLIYAGKDGSVVTYQSTLLEGPYPNYEAVIPDPGDGHLETVDRKVIDKTVDCIKRLQAYGQFNKLDSVLFRKNIMGWKGAHGFKTIQGPALFDFTLRGFSAKYLLQVFNDLQGDGIAVQSFAESTRGVFFRTKTETFCIMPRCLDEEDWEEGEEI